MLTKRIVFVLWICAASMIFFASFSDQIVLSSAMKRNVSLIFPEGWGFFTKNPRDPQLNVYKIQGHDTLRVLMNNHLRSNYYGFSRKSRVIGYESSLLVQAVNPDLWTETTMAKLHQEELRTDTISPEQPYRYFKEGHYLLSIYEPVPFAWAGNNQEQFNPLQVIDVIIHEKAE